MSFVWVSRGMNAHVQLFHIFKVPNTQNTSAGVNAEWDVARPKWW